MLLKEELHGLQLVINTLLGDRKTLKVLDAGCGWKGYKRYISIPEHAYVVSIDIAEEELRKNYTANEKIVGDIQSYELPSSEFDAVICWWVLEHLPRPDKALSNFLQSVKEDGIVVLAVPNVLSLKGLLTKYTPYSFHVWYYRAILGYKNHSPFPTFLRFSISPAALSRLANKHGLSIVYSYLYKHRDTNKIINAGVWPIRQIIKLLTFGRIDVGLEEFVIVLRKQRISTTDISCQAADEVSANTNKRIT